MHGDWCGLEDIPPSFGPAVVTIGNFDGVHLGHSRILQRAAKAARRDSLISAALTFDPHPLAVVAPEKAPKTLTSLRQRAELIREQGIDQVVVMPFTKELAQLSPLEFAAGILVEKLRAKRVLVGASFRFGRKQAGDTAMLRELGAELGFAVDSADTVVVNGKPVSSTRVRDLVTRGEMAQAKRLLGRPFCLSGPIVRGEGVGTKQTVPTLNLAPESEVRPADGVYITLSRLAGERAWRESITNVGMRPTFDGRNRTVETFLLGELQQGTPSALELGFVTKIRDERPFPSAASLREQIGIDIEVARRFFQRLRSLPSGSFGSS